MDDDDRESRDLKQMARRVIADTWDIRCESAEILRLSRRTREWIVAVRADAWHVRDHEEETGREGV